MKAEKCQVGCFGRPSYDQHRSSTGLSAQTTGVVITDVEPGSQGEDAGLLKDDVIRRSTAQACSLRINSYAWSAHFRRTS